MCRVFCFMVGVFEIMSVIPEKIPSFELKKVPGSRVDVNFVAMFLNDVFCNAHWIRTG